MFPEHAGEDVIVPFITHFSEAFSDHPDCEVDMIALMFPSKSEPYNFGKITVYPIDSGYKKNVFILPYLIKAVFKGIQLQRKNKYDGILCFWYRECAFIGQIVSRIFKVKSLVWMLGQDVKKNNIYLRLLKFPRQQIIMMSAQQRDIFMRATTFTSIKLPMLPLTKSVLRN
ncbi:hypothetical protein [Flavobacterium sp. 3HN19-14]|uniref:hypothetical protein n=1 Tax=Flavobacterium sp. 3HN19-14 TaxID=3448133 RepID=UPI003EDE9ACB